MFYPLLLQHVQDIVPVLGLAAVYDDGIIGPDKHYKGIGLSLI